MLLRTFIFLALAISARAATDVSVFRWVERDDEKRGAKTISFFVAPTAVKELFDADARGDQKAVEALGAKLPRDAWDCVVQLEGTAKTYAKDKVTLMYLSPPKTIVAIDSGVVEVDRAKKTVRIALKIVLESRVVDFIGNGVYALPEQPNNPPETKP